MMNSPAPALDIVREELIIKIYEEPREIWVEIINCEQKRPKVFQFSTMTSDKDSDKSSSKQGQEDKHVRV